MALYFNKSGITVNGNQGQMFTAFHNAYIPATNFGLRIFIPNQQNLERVVIDFVLDEIVNGVIGAPIRDRQQLLEPLNINNQYAPSPQYINRPNFYVHQVYVTPEVRLGTAINITTQCYHL